MNTKQRKLLTERHQHFKDEVNPADLFPYLTCLTQEDIEVTDRMLQNYGPIRALGGLLDRLKRRKNGFEQFVVALRKTNLDHVALLLDPTGKVEGDYDSTEKDNSKFQVLGTAIDVKIIARIYDTSHGEERKTDYEKIVVKEYKTSNNENSKKIRKVFQQDQDMPRGVEFVKTKEMGHALNMFSNKSEKQEIDSNRAGEEQQEKIKHEKEGDESETEKNYVGETTETNKDEERAEDGGKENDEAPCASSSSESSENDRETDCGGDSISAIFRLTNVDHAKQFIDPTCQS